ncbi:MAG TPA: N,N-dimethylformamidase beta subunit family domain-containing protein [Kineosporiaceae bacterium]
MECAARSVRCAGTWSRRGTGPGGRKVRWSAALVWAAVTAVALGACSSADPARSGTLRPAASRPGETGPDGGTAAGAAVGASVPPGCATASGSLPTGWVRGENSRPGTAVPSGTPRGPAVLGYLDAGAVGCGDTVQAHFALAPAARQVRLPAVRRVRLAAYRIGWYGGAGARRVWQSAPFPVPVGAVAAADSTTHLVTPRWPVDLRIWVDAGWAPGFYLLYPLDLAGAVAGPAVPLVVRDPAGTEPILFTASTLTWNAYNEWGGWSLYHGPSGSPAEAVANRARVVALQRPLSGSGYDQLQFMDLPVVRRLEHLAASAGVDVAYTTDVSVDADPQQLLHHAEIVHGGHSEYWTTAMYDGLQAAADAGVNLVFLGANNLWWHARLEGGSTGAPEREVVYRVLAEDPLRAGDPASATVLWSSAPLRRDPATILGQSHAGIGVHGGLKLLDPPAWYLAGTGLAAGSVLPGVVGNEADGFNPAAHNPPDTQVFAVGLLTGPGAPVTVSTSYSTRPSGAAVFAAGTTDWACEPTGHCKGLTVAPSVARAVGAMTDNVLVALDTPRAGLTHPARTGAVTTLATILAATLPAAARGTYGGAVSEELTHRSTR